MNSGGHCDEKAYLKIKPFQKKEAYEKDYVSQAYIRLPDNIKYLNPSVPEARDSQVFNKQSRNFFYFLFVLLFIQIWVVSIFAVERAQYLSLDFIIEEIKLKEIQTAAELIVNETEIASQVYLPFWAILCLLCHILLQFSGMFWLPC